MLLIITLGAVWICNSSSMTVPLLPLCTNLCCNIWAYCIWLRGPDVSPRADAIACLVNKWNWVSFGRLRVPHYDEKRSVARPTRLTTGVQLWNPISLWNQQPLGGSLIGDLWRKDTSASVTSCLVYVGSCCYVIFILLFDVRTLPFLPLQREATHISCNESWNISWGRCNMYYVLELLGCSWAICHADKRWWKSFSFIRSRGHAKLGIY